MTAMACLDTRHMLPERCGGPPDGDPLLSRPRGRHTAGREGHGRSERRPVSRRRGAGHPGASARELAAHLAARPRTTAPVNTRTSP